MDTIPVAYAEGLAALSLGPGWDKPEPSLWPEPKRDFPAFQWRYTDAREALHEAGGFVSVEQAERRNLICISPKEGNTYASTRTLVAAYQMVLPHESPRPHRHTPAALRIAVEVAEGTYTVVNGVRIDMMPGDVLLTPNGMWHSHGNDSDAEAYWIDILDVPLVQAIGAMFFHQHLRGRQEIERVDSASPMLFRPAELAAAAVERAPGVRVAQFGQQPTIGLEAVSLAGGAQYAVGRSTADTIYVTVEGEVTVDVEGELNMFTAAPGDVIAVPQWRRHQLSTGPGAVLVRATDTPLLKSINLYREES